MFKKIYIALMQIKFFIIIALSIVASKIYSSENKTFCIAHRGNSSVELENSEASILSAANMGVGAVEFDIRHTKDGVAIINHDKNLERVTAPNDNCDQKTPINELMYEDIFKCHLKNGERIPLFNDIANALKSYPIKLIIEYKSEPSISEMKLIADLYNEQPERIIFISFKEKFLDKIIKWRKLIPFLKETKVLRLKQIAYSRKDRFDGLNTQFLGKRHVKAAHKKGRLIGTFTKNSFKRIKKYLDRGVDFITTNYPKRCMEELQRRQF
jgi:glycerophosphoryl diester phosphodiesterase